MPITKDKAFGNPLLHQLVPGAGYVPHTRAPRVGAPVAHPANCSPPAGTPDGSIHVLRPPTPDAPARAFRWLATHKAWAPMTVWEGNRLAWSPAHLAAAGWAYVGPGRA